MSHTIHVRKDFLGDKHVFLLFVTNQMYHHHRWVWGVAFPVFAPLVALHFSIVDLRRTSTMVLAIFLVALSSLAHGSIAFNPTIEPATMIDHERLSTLEWLEHATDADQAAWRDIVNHQESISFCSLGDVLYPCWKTGNGQESPSARLAMDRQSLEMALAAWEASPAGKHGLTYMHQHGLGSLSHEEKLSRFNATINQIASFNRDSVHATFFTPYALMNATEFKEVSI
jgi:hypothetical protein